MGWQERELTPDAGLRHKLGHRMRELRNAKGWSLRHFGDVVRVNQSYLAKVERADQLPHRDVIVECDRALDAGGELCDLFDQVKRAEATSRGSGHVAKHVANPGDELGHESRDTGAWSQDEPATVAVFGDDGRPTVVTIPRVSLRQGIKTTSAGLILPGQVSRTEPISKPIEHFQAARRALADMDNLFGPLAAIPKAREQFKAIEQIVKNQRGGDLAEFLRVRTQYADLVGWLYQDSGQFADAGLWLDRALESANLSGDNAAVVFIMSRKAQLYSDMGQPEYAACIADAAVRLAPGKGPLAAIAATYSARGHALAGEEAVALDGYDTARDLLEAAEDDGTPWGRFFCDSYLGIQRSHSLVDLGRFTEAADGFRAAIAALPPGFRRDEGVYLAWEAIAHAGNEAPEQVLTAASEALDIGLETKSSRIITELINLDGMLGKWDTVPEVRLFRERLHGTIRKQA